MIFILIFVENCLLFDAIHFSVWLRTGSNPADINQFKSYTVKVYECALFFRTMICSVKFNPIIIIFCKLIVLDRGLVEINAVNIFPGFESV